jgi:uncharacterized protein Smg (DUF494 family)
LWDFLSNIIYFLFGNYFGDETVIQPERDSLRNMMEKIFSLFSYREIKTANQETEMAHWPIVAV